MKNVVMTVAGTVGSFMAAALGGWDTAIITLLAFMLIDFVTGWVVAAIFHASKKTNTGCLDSKVSWAGLCRKCMVLLLVVVANLLDKQIGANYIRDGVCIAFMVNELISIVENASLMGLPIPKVISEALEILSGDKETNT